MSDILHAMTLLMNSFNKYAGKEGDKDSLSKAELKELLQKEFGELVVVDVSDKEKMDMLFMALDDNQDNCVDFLEFVNLISQLTVISYEYFGMK